MPIFWGDIHNHCDISYGFGSLENALQNAAGHLDFCSITGHAMWPDLIRNEKERAFVVRYHEEGFQKLFDNWGRVMSVMNQANVPGEFVTFNSYEIHSRLHGDYHIISSDDHLPIIAADDHVDLINQLKLRNVMAIPHHLGYTPGYRGCNWDTFSNEISPIVEVYSKHGCGLSDDSPYPYLHVMGPRDSRSVAFTGLKNGHQFGFSASTDHHAGYPGSYGDGRLAVLASGKSRPEIWEAMKKRHAYAVTGDKIACSFTINDHPMGSILAGHDKREIHLDICGCDQIDRITLFKNLQPWKVMNGGLDTKNKKKGLYKIRIEMGWGNGDDGFMWQGSLNVDNGRIRSVEPCFRGRNILAPTPDMTADPELNKSENRVLESTPSSVAWQCTSFRNFTTLHAQTVGILVEVEGDAATLLQLKINGRERALTLGSLVQGSISFHLKPFASEAVLVHRAVPEDQYRLAATFEDVSSERPTDLYHVEVRQKNGQYAWLSPIYLQNNGVGVR